MSDYVSTCCGAPVRLMPEGSHRPYSTCWYECAKCGKPCNVRDPAEYKWTDKEEVEP